MKGIGRPSTGTLRDVMMETYPLYWPKGVTKVVLQDGGPVPWGEALFLDKVLPVFYEFKGGGLPEPHNHNAITLGSIRFKNEMIPYPQSWSLETYHKGIDLAVAFYGPCRYRIWIETPIPPLSPMRMNFAFMGESWKI